MDKQAHEFPRIGVLPSGGSLDLDKTAWEADLLVAEGFIEPHLWTGIGRARSGCGAAIVGSADQVLSEIEAYQKMGIRAFIFSGYPHLEESIRFAELVFPLLPIETRKKLTQPNLTGPFGEIVANNYTPDENKAPLKESA